jgi:hypothetical protein
MASTSALAIRCPRPAAAGQCSPGCAPTHPTEGRLLSDWRLRQGWVGWIGCDTSFLPTRREWRALRHQHGCTPRRAKQSTGSFSDARIVEETCVSWRCPSSSSLLITASCASVSPPRQRSLSRQALQGAVGRVYGQVAGKAVSSAAHCSCVFATRCGVSCDASTCTAADRMAAGPLFARAGSVHSKLAMPAWALCEGRRLPTASGYGAERSAS